MTEQRRFKGIWIPADLWLDRSLSVIDKVMLVEIDSLESPDRGCYASNKRFAEFFDLSVSRVSEVIKALERRGYIRVEYIRDGKQVVERRIRMVPRPTEEIDWGIRKTEGGVFGKHEEPYSENRRGYSENTQEREPQEINSRSKGNKAASPAAASPPNQGGEKVKRVSKRDQSIAFLIAQGVDPQHAADWMTARKGKEVTTTVWENVQREAARVGMTPAQAVQYAAGASWQGFNADWFLRNSGGAKPAPTRREEQRSGSYAAMFPRGMPGQAGYGAAARGEQDDRIVDGDARWIDGEGQ
ncbi:hypothetical protein C5615_09650 [Burkholderia cepacia]|uniref:Helix-turn-helix domain-containing protein n=1 Tax=Burkholderia cepacia TaxID=292 RepID=A0A2S8IY92_BURCE|nr:helix-turn-helix domain-containing protein [Burkholderia cepacia]PQP19698.1 hypothetical protein C5615_09650 [Burkholderia cepacia]HDR9506888.1 helix-turn-helix domain-containing protein [Burkholderia cepacia]